MKTLIHAPLFKLVIFFIAGILLGGEFGLWPVLLSIPSLLILLILKWREKRALSHYFELVRAFCIGLLMIASGAGMINLTNEKEPISELEKINCQEVILSGKITSEIKSNQYGRSAQVEVFGYWEDCEWIGILGNAQMYIDTANHIALEKWDSVFVKVYLTTAFSKSSGYLSYLHSKGIFHSAYVKDFEVIGKENDFTHYPEFWQKKISSQIGGLVKDTAALSIAQAMFLGDKREMDKKTRNQFAIAGLSHILAISGLHVGIVFGVLTILFMPFHLFNHGLRIKYAFILLALIIYMLITGASPAVVRAVIMLGTVLIFKMTYQRFHILNVLAISAFIQLIYDPSILFNIGFQLSYSAVLGIVTLLPVFERYFSSTQLILKYIFSWISVTIAASLATFPFVWFYFEQFPTYFLLSNILTSLLVTVIVFFGFLMVLFAYVPGINHFLGELTEFLLKGLMFIVDQINMLPHAVISANEISIDAVKIVFLQLIIAAILFLIPGLLKIGWGRKKEAYILSTN